MNNKLLRAQSLFHTGQNSANVLKIWLLSSVVKCLIGINWCRNCRHLLALAWHSFETQHPSACANFPSDTEPGLEDAQLASFLQKTNLLITLKLTTKRREETDSDLSVRQLAACPQSRYVQSELVLIRNSCPTQPAGYSALTDTMDSTTVWIVGSMLAVHRHKNDVWNRHTGDRNVSRKGNVVTRFDLRFFKSAHMGKSSFF